MKKISLYLAIPLLIAAQVASNKHVVLLQADASQDTYTLINKAFAPKKGNVVEVSDCSHEDFGPHITQQFDQDLNKDVFVFHAHLNEDNDRCKRFDRQRTEIKTYKASGEQLIGTAGETHKYTWLFKLDENFQPSAAFTHLHQLKAIGGPDDSMPLLTFTARKKKITRFEVRHGVRNAQETLASIDLNDLKGQWIAVEETVVYGEEGSLEITLSRKRDNKTLLTLKKSLNMWVTGADLIRPKWGIYRSLNAKEQLRDEQVRFADFEITEF